MSAFTSRSAILAFIFLTAAQAVVLANAPRGVTPVSTMPGWGLEVGRADEGDVAELLADQVALKRAMTRVNESLKAELGKERQAALLGYTEELKGLGDIMAAAEKWWKEHIDGPIERISKNPAASCDESREMLALVLGRNRQRQLLGFPTDNAEIFGGPVFHNVRKRCREEKLDECNATGRFKQIIEWAMGEERLMALVAGIGDGDPAKWRAEALTECAVYELHYVSTTTVDDAFKLDSVIDGRVPIKYKPMGEGVTDEPIIEGEIATGENPFLQKFVCDYGEISVTCSPGGEAKRGAYGRIMDMEIKHREYFIDASGKSQSRVEGENKLVLKFMSAIMGVVAIVKGPDSPPVTIPFLEVGGTGFWIAHKKARFEESYVKFTETTRGVYPIMFEFTKADSDVEDDVPATDSTKFELIHKPNKKPFDRGPATPRKVIRPKA